MKSAIKFLSLLFIVLFVINCEKDDDFKPQNTLQQNVISPTIKIKTVAINDDTDNLNLLKTLTEIKTQTKNAKHNKAVGFENYNFQVHTNRVNYIETTNGHSYTFAITRPEDNGYLENLMLSLQDDGSYKAFLFVYTLTEEQLQQIEEQRHLTADVQINQVYLLDGDFTSLLPTQNNKVVYESDCLKIIENEWHTNPENGQEDLLGPGDTCNHPVGGDSEFGECTIRYTYSYVNTCNTNSGGGNPNNTDSDVDYNDPETPPITSGDDTEYLVGGPTETTTITTIPQPWEKILNCYLQSSFNGGPSLSSEQLTWLQNNKQAAGPIANYLDNNCSVESQEFAIAAINALQDNDEDGQPDGEVDINNAIILDQTAKNSQKLKCVYEKLKQISNTIFKDIVYYQFGSSNKNHIQISVGNLPSQIAPGTVAYTYTTYNANSNNSLNSGNIKHIRISSTFIQNASSIEIALMLIHESIHAELLDRCIKLGLIQEINALGVTVFTSNPTILTLQAAIFNQLLVKYNAYPPIGNSEWNHDLFNALNYRIKLAQNLVQAHNVLNDPSNDFLTNVSNDPNIVGGPYTLSDLMDNLSWVGLEDTQEYINTIVGTFRETKKQYVEGVANTKYTHNCN